MSLMDFDPFEHLKMQYTSSANYYTNFTTTSSCDPPLTDQITLETLKISANPFIDFTVEKNEEVKKSTLPMAPVLFDPKELVL